MPKLEYSSLFVVSVIVSAAGGLALGGLTHGPAEPQNSALKWSNEITVYKNGDKIDRFHNTLTDQGKQYIAGKLFNATPSAAKHTSNNFTYISLGNGTDVTSGDSILDSEITCCGLSRAKASSVSYDENNGVYTLKNQFTADLGSGDPSSIKVNTTGLNFESGNTNTLVSGGSFTSATLKEGDKITVTHEITISGQ